MTAKPGLREQYPTPFKVRKVSDSFIGKELTFFFVTGVVTKDQYRQVAGAIQLLAELEIETDRLVISTLLNQEQLEEFKRGFEPLAKSWRGQYYPLANAIVDACEDALKS